MGQKAPVGTHHLSSQFLSAEERTRLDQSLDQEGLKRLVSSRHLDISGIGVGKDPRSPGRGPRGLQPDPQYASIPLIKNKYRVLSKLGAGAFGDVLKIVDTASGELLAMKMISMSKRLQESTSDPDDPTLGGSEEEKAAIRRQVVMSAETELKILPRLQHPNIVKYVDAFLYPWVSIKAPDAQDHGVTAAEPPAAPAGPAVAAGTSTSPSIQKKPGSHMRQSEVHLCLIMEYVKGSDLDELLRYVEENSLTIPKPIVIKWFVLLLQVLRYFHSLSIIHRDLKPDNILVTYDDISQLSTMNLKLTDFGVGKDLRIGGLGKEMRGNIFYTATECLRGGIDSPDGVTAADYGVATAADSSTKGYDSRCDVFSLGLIFCQTWLAQSVDTYHGQVNELCRLVKDIPELNAAFCEKFQKEDIYDNVTYVELLLFLHESGEFQRRFLTSVTQSDKAVAEVVGLMLAPDVENRAYARDLLSHPIVATWEMVLGMRGGGGSLADDGSNADDENVVDGESESSSSGKSSEYMRSKRKAAPFFASSASPVESNDVFNGALSTLSRMQKKPNLTAEAQKSRLSESDIDFSAIVTFLTLLENSTQDEALIFGNCLHFLSKKMEAISGSEELMILLTEFDRLGLFERIFRKTILILDQSRNLQERIWPQFFNFLLTLLQMDSGRYLHLTSVCLRKYGLIGPLKNAILQFHSARSLSESVTTSNTLFLFTLIVLLSSPTVKKTFKEFFLPFLLLWSANPKNVVLFYIIQSLIPLLDTEKEMEKVFTVYRGNNMLIFRPSPSMSRSKEPLMNSLHRFQRNESVLRVVLTRCLTRLEELWKQRKAVDAEERGESSEGGQMIASSGKKRGGFRNLSFIGAAADDRSTSATGALRRRSNSTIDGGSTGSLNPAPVANSRRKPKGSRFGRRNASFFGAGASVGESQPSQLLHRNIRKKMMTNPDSLLGHSSKMTDIDHQIESNLLFLLFLICKEKEKIHSLSYCPVLDVPQSDGQALNESIDASNQLAFLARQPMNVQIGDSGDEFVCINSEYPEEVASMISLRPICVFRKNGTNADGFSERGDEYAIGYYEVMILNGGMNDSLKCGIYMDYCEQSYLLDCNEGLITFSEMSYAQNEEEVDGELLEEEVEGEKTLIHFIRIRGETDVRIGCGVTNKGNLFFAKNNQLIRPFINLGISDTSEIVSDETALEETRIYAHFSVSNNESLHCKVNFGTNLISRPFYFNFFNNVQKQKLISHNSQLSTALKVLKSLNCRIISVISDDFPTVEDGHPIILSAESIKKTLTETSNGPFHVTDPVLISAYHKSDCFERIYHQTNLRFVPTEETDLRSIQDRGDTEKFQLCNPKRRHSVAADGPPSPVSAAPSTGLASGNSQKSFDRFPGKDSAAEMAKLTESVSETTLSLSLLHSDVDSLRAELRQQQLRHDQAMQLIGELKRDNEVLRSELAKFAAPERAPKNPTSTNSMDSRVDIERIVREQLTALLDSRGMPASSVFGSSGARQSVVIGKGQSVVAVAKAESKARRSRRHHHRRAKTTIAEGAAPTMVRAPPPLPPRQRKKKPAARAGASQATDRRGSPTPSRAPPPLPTDSGRSGVFAHGASSMQDAREFYHFE